MTFASIVASSCAKTASLRKDSEPLPLLSSCATIVARRRVPRARWKMGTRQFTAPGATMFTVLNVRVTTSITARTALNYGARTGARNLLANTARTISVP